MKQLNFQIKRIYLLAVLAVFLAFSVIDTAGITLPFIEIPLDEETGETVETGEPKDLSNQTDLMELETGDQTNGKTETDSKQIFATPEPDQKGCGSTLLQSGAITVLIIGIAVSFLTRKKKSTE